MQVPWYKNIKRRLCPATLESYETSVICIKLTIKTNLFSSATAQGYSTTKSKFASCETFLIILWKNKCLQWFYYYPPIHLHPFNAICPSDLVEQTQSSIETHYVGMFGHSMSKNRTNWFWSCVWSIFCPGRHLQRDKITCWQWYSQVFWDQNLYRKNENSISKTNTSKCNNYSHFLNIYIKNGV